jgi:anti-sigma factor RsiW
MISSYIDNELPEKDTRELLAHLEHCERCTEELSTVMAQKERVTSLRSYYNSPPPDPDFPQKVMAQINAISTPEMGFLRLFFRNFAEEFLMPIKRPALALPLILLLVTGIVSGFFLQSMSNRPAQQLLSVYELSAQTTSSQDVEIGQAEEKAELHLFDHFADTSVETFAARPCLLEYAAYTCSSPVEDY